MMNKGILISMLLGAVLTGCASSDRILRPEHVTYVPWETNATDVTISGRKVALKCRDKRDSLSNVETTRGEDSCLYYSVDERTIFETFGGGTVPASELYDLRNSYISFLLNLSEHNCTTFLNRAFASKSEMDTSSRTFNDILTGLSAASANAQPHAAAGLSLANLIVGKTVDNINSTYYFEKTFQALASSIYAEREERKESIRKNLTQPIHAFTMYDALALVHRYDNACSIRVGLEKLQGIAQEAASKNATIAAKTTQLELKEKELISTKATVDALTNKLVTLVGSMNGRQSEIVEATFNRLKSAKNDSERKFAIGEIEGILLSNQNNIQRIETTAGELKKTTVGTPP